MWEWVEVSRPYNLCAHRHSDQFPVDPEPDVVNTEFSPGARRRLAVVGEEAPCPQAREQMNVLAGEVVGTRRAWVRK